ncbi:MAG: DUF1592 domain-containing protein [Verrucomicrobiota bacterium]
MFVRRIYYFVGLPFLLLLASERGLFGADPQPKGREIYKQLCVKCHGKDGQGVKGKYDDALFGDWSREKLTRYIDKNMPEDAPDKCDGPDADAVARYIYDAFYSPQARARNHPARIELVRLTNRQYVNTVADLLKHFSDSDGPINSERGLRAIYCNSQNLWEKKVFERIDRQINFDFGAGRPEVEGIVSNVFSMQWRGSLLAEESGEYEIILKTPNGVRLWLNDEDEPVIDAWVASAEVNEHKTNIRLIGGRAYPLRLDYFNFKQKIASIALLWKPPHGIQQPIPTRNLSPIRVTPTFVVTTPFPPDDSSVGYERGVSISKAWDEATTEAAIETANYVVKNLDRLSRSKSVETNRATKIQSFCAEFVATAFRRPLTVEQKNVFVSSQFTKKRNVEEAMKRVVLLTLKSPRFLYLGLDNSKPNDYEVAARLSFNLWDSLPNADLWKCAVRGELHTREQANEQAKRMLSDPRARAKMQYFLHQWLQMNRAEDLSKDAKSFPGFTPEIISDLRTSLDIFLEDTVWNGASDYRKLLLADYLFLNNRLAEFYGMNTNAADDFVKVNVDDKQRSGVVTHPYLLAAFSYQKSTSPIHRGVFLTRNIVGRALKPPPMAQVFKDADFAPNLTMREKVSELTRSQSCQTCHSVINPLGFSLENFDAVGRFRKEENARPIDAASDYVTDDGKTVRFSGARDVAEFAVSSEHAQNAFIEQLFNQIVKQPMAAYGADVISRLRQSFVASGFNMQKLLVDIASISALQGIEKQTDPKKKS